MSSLKNATLALALLGAIAVGCGRKAAVTGGTDVPTLGSGQSAPQLIAPDQPTSKDIDVSKRPKLEGEALAAYKEALEAWTRGALLEAKAKLEVAIKADPKAYKALYTLGVVEERLKAPKAALDAYQRALAVVPDYEAAIVALALLMARGGDVSGADSLIQQKLAKVGRSPAVISAHAEVKSLAGNSGEAQRLVREALKINSSFAPAMLASARDHHRNRRLDLALFALNVMLGPEVGEAAEGSRPRAPRDAGGWLLRGVIRKEQNNRGAATVNFEKAVEIRPDLVEPRLHLATYSLEAGNAADAAKQLEQAIRWDEGNVLIHLGLGDAYRLLERPADSQKHLEWVVAREPQMVQAHYDLGLLFLTSKNIPGFTDVQAAERAIAELNRYKKEKPRSARGLPEDADELIIRAQIKRDLAVEAAKKPAPVPATKPAAPAASSAAPTPAKPSTAPAAASAASAASGKAAFPEPAKKSP